MDGLRVDWEFDFDDIQGTVFSGNDIYSPDFDGVQDFTIHTDKSSIKCEERDCTFRVEFSRKLLTEDFQDE